MKKLFYFTDWYPFGVGETPFVAPEIDYFSRFYEVHVVSIAPEKGTEDAKNISLLPKNVHLIHCGKKKWVRRILGTLAFPFSRLGRKEIGSIFATKKKILPRIALSSAYYGIARSLELQFRQAGIFNDVEHSLYYTFWFGRSCAALSFMKEQRKELTLMSRINGYELYNERAVFGRQPFQECKAAACKKIIFAASYPREYFINTFKIPGFEHSKCELSWLGSPSPGRMPKREIGGGLFTIVSCSNVIPLKRVDLICRALDLLQDCCIKWIHFGDGPELNKIRDLAAQKGVNATLPGQISNADILRFYSNNYVDVFLTTSSTEGGCPVSIQEALAYGIPIIGTPIGGITDAVSDGENGYLLTENPTPEEVAKAIRKVYEMSEEDRLKMRGHSKAFWQKRFDLRQNVKRTKEIIDSVAEA